MKVLLATAALAALAATPALAQVGAGQWGGSVTIGGDFPISGDVHKGATAPVADLGPLNPALAGVSAELRIQSRSFDDIYGTALGIAGEVTYGLTDNSEIFGTFRYQAADEGTVQVGTAFVPALNTSLPVRGTFGDLKTYALEGGYRYYFGGETLKPYVAGRIGLARTDAINATFRIPDASINIVNVPFYDESTSGVFGADVGVSYALGDKLNFIAETGLRYTTKLEDDDSAIGGLGLASINDTGERLDAQVRVGLKFGF